MPEDNLALLTRDHKFLKLARIMSRKSNAKNFRFGSVITKGTEIVGLGSNDVVKTHPKSTTVHGHIHAELSAILNARCDVNGMTMYVFRAGQKERPLLAKPCKECRALLFKQGIRWVCYSTDGDFHKVTIGELLK